MGTVQRKSIAAKSAILLVMAWLIAGCTFQALRPRAVIACYGCGLLLDEIQP